MKSQRGIPGLACCEIIFLAVTHPVGVTRDGRTGRREADGGEDHKAAQEEATVVSTTQMTCSGDSFLGGPVLRRVAARCVRSGEGET